MVFIIFANSVYLRLFGIWTAYLLAIVKTINSLGDIYSGVIICHSGDTVVIYSTPQYIILENGVSLNDHPGQKHIHATVDLTECGLPWSPWNGSVHILYYIQCFLACQS